MEEPTGSALSIIDFAKTFKARTVYVSSKRRDVGAVKFFSKLRLGRIDSPCSILLVVVVNGRLDSSLKTKLKDGVKKFQCNVMTAELACVHSFPDDGLFTVKLDNVDMKITNLSDGRTVIMADIDSGAFGHRIEDFYKSSAVMEAQQSVYDDVNDAVRFSGMHKRGAHASTSSAFKVLSEYDYAYPLLIGDLLDDYLHDSEVTRLVVRSVVERLASWLEQELAGNDIQYAIAVEHDFVDAERQVLYVNCGPTSDGMTTCVKRGDSVKARVAKSKGYTDVY